MTPTDPALDQQLNFSQVTIGVLTALEEEYSACLGIFDPNRQGTEKQKQATSGTLTCWLCAVPAKYGGKHIVAITRLTSMGNIAAAIAANILLQHCERIKSIIMCGIAGAIPNPKKPENHVRLGDIVVSGPRGIIQYDFGKQRVASPASVDPFNGFEFRVPLRPPCPHLLTAVGNIHSDEKLLSRDEIRDWEAKVDAFLNRYQDTPTWKRPAPAKDKLVDTPDGTGEQIRHPKDNERRSRRPRVFRGAIGAANIVLADPKRRDALRDRWDIRAVEMEGSGVADASWIAQVGYLVVRGTCDYCNSTKNDDWHFHAALIAAAYTRTVIEYLHTQTEQTPESSPTVPSVPRRTAPTTLELPAVPPQIDVSKLPGTDHSYAKHGAETEFVKFQGSPVVLKTADPNVAPPTLGIAPNVALEPQLTSTVHSQIQELYERLNSLLESGRWKEADLTGVSLEELLRHVPPRGVLVREGWLSLAALEKTRLFAALRSKEPPDVTRLQRLRKEAENVTD